MTTPPRDGSSTPGADGLASAPEFDAVRAIVAGARDGAPGEGPGDDAALLSGGRVVSVDTSVEGVHFRLDRVSAREAGGRAARAALSDLAAMGARADAVLVALTGPDRDALVAAGRGARAAAEAFGARLVGGDLVAAASPLSISVTVLGSLGEDPPFLRSGARPGDALWVTGALGAAAFAVEAWARGETPPPAARDAFLHPIPRTDLVPALRASLHATAAIDLSDGLAADARHLARASRVALHFDAASIPVAEVVRAHASPDDALRLALEGGEDFELLLAAPDGDGIVEAFEGATTVRLTRVGVVAEGEGAQISGVDGSSSPLRGGYRHWRDQ
ncbi:MAG: thiamine-phosphate kinase [Longimicrobiales bacterium]|nr:thiamine-phosphate kinase [Longimicrobiales bacterium]